MTDKIILRTVAITCLVGALVFAILMIRTRYQPIAKAPNPKDSIIMRVTADKQFVFFGESEEEIGRLQPGPNGYQFEGNAEESAKIFFQFLVKQLNALEKIQKEPEPE